MICPRIARLIPFILPGLLLGPGCGTSPTGNIEGTVKFRNKLIGEGRIDLLWSGDGHGLSPSGIIESGHYRLTKVPLGIYRVQIRGLKNGHDFIAADAAGNDEMIEITAGEQHREFSLK